MGLFYSNPNTKGKELKSLIIITYSRAEHIKIDESQNFYSSTNTVATRIGQNRIFQVQTKEQENKELVTIQTTHKFNIHAYTNQ